MKKFLSVVLAFAIMFCMVPTGALAFVVCAANIHTEHNFISYDETPRWDSYYCSVCGYVCEHVSEKEGVIEYEGDCVTAAGYEYNCPYCGYHEEDFAPVPGHDFTLHEAEKGVDCQTAGTKAYNSCSACEKNFESDAEDLEPIENAITDLTGEFGDHEVLIDEAGNIVYGNDADEHWAQCAICGEKLDDGVMHSLAVEPNGAQGHTVSCDVCEYSANVPHTFGDDNICDVEGCTWGCTEHNYKNVTTLATATKDGKIENKCTVCGKVKSTRTIKCAKTFTLSASSYTYDGNNMTPTVTVKNSVGTKLKENTDYTVSCASGRKNVGTYKVTVKLIGNYTGTKTLTFNIIPEMTTISKLTACTNSITINIAKRSIQVTGYQVQYSTSKDFTNAKTKTISSYETTKYPLKGLSTNETYYVRVRTYKTVSGNNYYSDWSRVKNINTVAAHSYDNACDTSCNICGDTRAITHTYDSGKVTKKATCKATGVKTYTCTGCKATKTKTIVKIAHKYDSGKVTKKATCKAAGVKTYTCTVCETTKTKSIAKLTTHNYSNNCDTTCNICGITRTITHTYTNNHDTMCNACGGIRSRSSYMGTQGNLTYRIDPDANGGKVTITKCKTTASGTLTVPSKIKGRPVVAVAASAFKGCAKLTKISLPNSVTSIGEKAFQGCNRLYTLELSVLKNSLGYFFGGSTYEVNSDVVPRSLRTLIINNGNIPSYACSNCDNISTVKLGSGVTSVGAYAFNSCNSLTSVTVGNKVKTIGTEAFSQCVSLVKATIGSGTVTIGDWAFANCESLTTVSMGSGTKNINDSAFYNCVNLSKLTLGKNVKNIGNFAFANCRSLKKVTIPNSTKEIGTSAFQNCTKLSSVKLGSKVATIFDYAFYGCKSLKSIIIPNSTTSVGEYCFAKCTSLQRAIFKGRIEHIENYTFDGCTSLTTVAFPKNVDTIAYRAFYNCYNLKNVYYEGSKSQRSNIIIPAGNGPLDNATWYYNSCLGSKDHTYKTTALTKATLKKNGSMTQKCTVCGKKAKSTIKYAKSFKLSTTTYTYNGKVKTPSVTVKDSAGKKLKKGTDYTVSYSNGRKKVGTYKVTIKMKGKYSGSKTLSFKIKK